MDIEMSLPGRSTLCLFPYTGLLDVGQPQMLSAPSTKAVYLEGGNCTSLIQTGNQSHARRVARKPLKVLENWIGFKRRTMWWKSRAISKVCQKSRASPSDE